MDVVLEPGPLVDILDSIGKRPQGHFTSLTRFRGPQISAIKAELELTLRLELNQMMPKSMSQLT